LGVGLDAKKLGEAFAKAKAAGKEIKCAMTFPGGTHDMWIRYWLAASGIDPDKDLSTIVVPPRAGFCLMVAKSTSRDRIGR
jgi:nitrate/nitrite transport system substrate-binding protein